MATMLPCPACQKNISAEAAACPKCGQPITDEVREAALKKAAVDTKRKGVGCLAIIAALVLIGSYGSQQDKETTTKSQTTSATPAQIIPKAETKGPTFSLTRNQFINNYNKIAKSNDIEGRATISETSSDERVTIVNLNDFSSAIIMTNFAGEIESISYSGTGDKTELSGKSIVASIACTIAAMDPNWTMKKGLEIFRISDFGIDSETKKSITTKGMQFNFAKNALGVHLTIKPAK